MTNPDDSVDLGALKRDVEAARAAYDEAAEFSANAQQAQAKAWRRYERAIQKATDARRQMSKERNS